MNPAVMLIAAAIGGAPGSNSALAQTGKSGVERLYIRDCSTSVGPDRSRWMPGTDVGKPLDMVGNCYLTRIL